METIKTLTTLFGSEGAAAVLAFLARSDEGYASEIAGYLDANLYTVQNQLAKFEAGGILESRNAPRGRARIYSFDRKHPLADDIKSLVRKAASQDARERREPRASLPTELREFFWDVSLNNLSWATDREFIIRRLLTVGSWEAVSWLRRQLGDAALKRWLIEHKGRGLSPRHLRFWALALGLPRNQVNAWMRAARTDPWHLR